MTASRGLRRGPRPWWRWRPGRATSGLSKRAGPSPRTSRPGSARQAAGLGWVVVNVSGVNMPSMHRNRAARWDEAEPGRAAGHCSSRLQRPTAASAPRTQCTLNLPTHQILLVGKHQNRRVSHQRILDNLLQRAEARDKVSCRPGRPSRPRYTAPVSTTFHPLSRHPPAARTLNSADALPMRSRSQQSTT